MVGPKSLWRSATHEHEKNNFEQDWILRRLNISTMANGASIDAVYTIANIPRPIDQANGRILASTVHSLPNSKKRKRSQVAVSIDGEGVNIYSVWTVA